MNSGYFMFEISCFEAFEDWFVVESEPVQFDDLAEALLYLKKSIDNILYNETSGSGILQFLQENHPDLLEDPSSLNEYSSGFLFNVTDELDEILLQVQLSYDPLTKRVSPPTKLEQEVKNSLCKKYGQKIGELLDSLYDRSD